MKRSTVASGKIIRINKSSRRYDLCILEDAEREGKGRGSDLNDGSNDRTKNAEMYWREKHVIGAEEDLFCPGECTYESSLANKSLFIRLHLAFMYVPGLSHSFSPPS